MSYQAKKSEAVLAFEKSYLHEALVQTGGNVTEAARQAKMDKANFCRILRRVGIDPDQYREKEK